MNIYKSKTQPTFIYIVLSYLKRYSAWILFTWFVFFLMFRSQNFSIFLLPIVLLSFFIGYGRSYPKNRIIYKVIIDYVNKRMTLYTYVLCKHRIVIPFDKLYFACLKKDNKMTKTDELLVAFGKQPWPVIGTVKSTGSSYWEYDKVKELVFELHQIKKDNLLWRPKNFKNPLGQGYKNLKFDFEEE